MITVVFENIISNIQTILIILLLIFTVIYWYVDYKENPKEWKIVFSKKWLKLIFNKEYRDNN